MEKLLTVKQLGELLQISTRTIYEWTHIGYVPHYKLPKGIRFKMAEVEKWLKKKSRKGRDTYKIDIPL